MTSMARIAGAWRRLVAPSAIAMSLASLALAAPGPTPVRWDAKVPPPLTSVSHRDARGTKAPLPRLLEGRAGAMLAGPSPGTPEEIALKLVRERLHPVGDLRVLSVVQGTGAASYVTIEQEVEGLPVALGRISVAVMPDGSVLAARVGELAAGLPRPVASPLVADAAGARRAARASFGVTRDLV
jgi:hypothetical protein